MSEDLSLVPSSNPTQSVSVQLARASARVAGFLEAGLQGAANTERAYTSDLKSYVAFCERHGLLALPANVDTLTEYVAYLATEKPAPKPGTGGDGEKKKQKGQQPLTRPHALATIQRHLAAIRKAHQLAGYRLPATLDALNLVMEGIARTLGKRQDQAPAFTVEELKHALRRIDLETSAGIRDRALLLLGFAGAFRRSELVELNIEQLEFTERALLVHLAKSKTNQYGAMENKAIFYAPTLDYCPVAGLAPPAEPHHRAAVREDSAGGTGADGYAVGQAALGHLHQQAGAEAPGAGLLGPLAAGVLCHGGRA